MVAGAALLLLAGCELVGGASADDEVVVDEEAAARKVAAAVNLPPGVSAEEVERGRELFLPCAVCHGLDGRGNQLGPSLRDGEWIHISGSLEEIEALIRTGVPEPEQYPVPMVPLGGGDYDADDLRAVAAYVYAISHPVAATPTAGN